MLNQVILMGRILDIDTMTIVVNDEVYVNISASDTIAEKLKENCKKGDLIAVKGHLIMDGGNIAVAADKITYLTSRADA